MTAAPAPASRPPEDLDPRRRARERLYVFCQTAAWLFLLVVQIVFVLVLPQKDTPRDIAVTNVAIVGYTIALGWLITHLTRPLLTRWGWKNLGWRALAPRIFATAAVQSALWTAVGFAYPYGVLQLPWSSKVSLPAILGVSWVNGMLMLAGWLCLYFFYHLFDRFNRLQIEQLQLSAYAKESELRALKSQVNPHFIFNALNSLRALIDEDPARARQAVTQLANLLRYSLQSAQAETVAFEDELRVVHDYLALEQVRHEERLRVRLDIDPATLGLAVPPLLLQTLVENAVKYGISARPEGGEVAIVARCREGRLELRVENPGRLDADAAHAPAGGSTGLGLKNAAERLRLFFGDRASLRLRAEAGERVVAEVSIPAPVPSR